MALDQRGQSKNTVLSRIRIKRAQNQIQTVGLFSLCSVNFIVYFMRVLLVLIVFYGWSEKPTHHTYVKI